MVVVFAGSVGAMGASEAVREAADGLVCRPLRRVRIKGRSEPLLVHEPLGVAGASSAELSVSTVAAGRLECSRSILPALDAGDRSGAKARLRRHLASDAEDRAAAALLGWLERDDLGDSRSG